MIKETRKDFKTADRYCEYCGKKLYRKKFSNKYEDFSIFMKRKYCDRECMRRAFLAEANKEQTYSNAHTTARNINKLLLNKTECEICGSTQNLDIHHKDWDWNNNAEDNLMCLCRSCHMKQHRKNGVCSICGKPVKGYGLCDKHYQRFKRHGNPYFVNGKDERM